MEREERERSLRVHEYLERTTDVVSLMRRRDIFREIYSGKYC